MKNLVQILSIIWSIVTFIIIAAFFFGGEWGKWEDVKDKLKAGTFDQKIPSAVNITTGEVSNASPLDKPQDFICKNNQVLIGVKSIHDNKAEDRRFTFICGKVSIK